ncbi:MAG: tetratricopeptide repeat protein [Hydrogenophaga sp.]|uniref:tetratricopeptide repeat protein n=1 Tax=Hydrogenophaga sp. TaxID=1904254 RepID=UPI001BBE987B|nr:tetratricopeptide repeat protein [Hydrogenophaga sp.]MBS3911061.1 tetratricopeptide repeat protein [Hydrogenophaga sp.]MDP2163827.1 tetratricopeptide repeat protein [Hydrogenophaga sp.]
MTTKFHTPQTLLERNKGWLVLVTAMGSMLTPPLAALAQSAQPAQATQQPEAAGNEAFWLNEASLANQAGDKARARTAYDRALALNPSNLSTRLQVIGFESDGGDKQRLAEHLKLWQADAEKEPAYWSAYALALLQLSRHDDSLIWYQRQVRHNPADIAWQLSFAYLVAQAGRPEEARELRREILPRMRQHASAIKALPASDRKVLMQAQASLTSDFEGAPASEPILLEMLDLGYRDAGVYELLVAATLAQGKHKEARQWLDRAQAEGFRLPAYQQLGVALAQNDHQAIETALAERGQELSATDRVTALRRLGRNDEALALIEANLPQAQGTAQQGLLRQRDEIRYAQRRQFDISLESKNLGYLDIDSTLVQVTVPQSWGRWTLRGASNRLRADMAEAYFSVATTETDVAVLADLPLGGDPVRFTLGTNQRSDKSVVYSRAEWTHALGPALSTRVDFMSNAIVEDSAALRAVGMKDKLAFTLSGKLGEPSYGRIELAAQRFSTRQGTPLGRGERVEFELGTRPAASLPGWNMRVSGSAERNRLEPALPAALVGSVLSPMLSVDSIVAKRFSTLGVGTTLRWGEHDPIKRQMHGLLDAWFGRQWPASEQAYNARAVVSIPLAQKGMLDLEAYYSTVQSDFSSKANKSVRVGYRLAF